jgi:hypothetical protein
MKALGRVALTGLVGVALSIPASASNDRRAHDPLRFFEGRTESISIVNVMMHKPYRTRAMGVGHIRSDGTLDLVQRLEREGEPTRTRRWLIKQVGDGRYSGTMNEATSPVNIEEVEGRYRFRFKMKGNLSVEQWLTPEPDWRSATNRLTVKKFGIKVGSSDGIIRKLS